MSAGGLGDLVREVERAIAIEFGVHPDAVTGRATERRCILASCVLAAFLSRAGLSAQMRAGELSVYRCGTSPLDISLHAVVCIEGKLLLDASIAQAHRERFGDLFDVDYGLLPVPSGLRDGCAVWLQNGPVRISFTANEELTARARATPDAEAGRIRRLLASIGRRACCGPRCAIRCAR